MNPIVNMLMSILTGPLLTQVTELMKAWTAGKISQAELEAQVKTALMTSLVQLNAQQLELLKAEIGSEDPWVRRWRPVVAVSFACVLLWYAIGVPIAVDWLGMPPLRVGDKLLEWIVTLLGGCLGAFAIGRTLEKIALAWRK